jgi:hypothetical protein
MKAKPLPEEDVKNIKRYYDFVRQYGVTEAQKMISDIKKSLKKFERNMKKTI